MATKKKLIRKNTNTTSKAPPPETTRKKIKIKTPRSWDEVEGKTVVPIQLGQKKIYPSPKKGLIFKARWDEFVEDVTKRENFKPGHLQQLSILCDLYEEYAILLEDVKREGYTYESVGRNGTQFKPRPEVVQMNRVRADIRNFSKTLGLLLVKDTSTNADADENEWGDQDE